jgi:CRP-like cAMP-binding protein
LLTFKNVAVAREAAAATASSVAVVGAAAMEIHLGKATPTYASAVTEDLLEGARLLRQAFLEAPSHSAGRNTVLIRSDATEPPILLINRGIAYRSLALDDGRRSIVDLLLPTDIVVGLDHAVVGFSTHEVVAANAVVYRLLKPARVRELLRDPRVALRALALVAEEQRRAHLHLTATTRLDSRGRLAAMILGIYERLRRQDLIMRPTFNLPLTQDQIADYLGITVVHVSRTLRRLREEKIVSADRQVVIILDLDRLRLAASGASTRDVAEPDETERLSASE